MNQLSTISVPVLVLAGAEDQALPEPHSSELAECIVGARFEVQPHVAHLAPREAPTAEATLLAEFLFEPHQTRPTEVSGS